MFDVTHMKFLGHQRRREEEEEGKNEEKEDDDKGAEDKG